MNIADVKLKNDVRLLCGDALTELRKLASVSVHCIVTSPPYFGLRRYSAGSLEMGSEATPEAYIAGMAGVFREARRVLRDDAGAVRDDDE